MRNVHIRTIDASVQTVGALLDRLSSDDDPVWPTPAWPPMVLDRPLGVGARGGHGPIRYHVVAYEPGRRIRFAFDRPIGDGWHELRVEAAGPSACTITHELRARPAPRMRVAWPLAIRWLHDALIEDAMDNVERAATGRVGRPSRWSPLVRVLRRWPSRRVTTVGIPDAARLLRRIAADDDWDVGAAARGAETGTASPAGDPFAGCDLADAYRVRLPHGASRDPLVWRDAVFTAVPLWVGAAMLLRNALVGLVGIDRGDTSAFDPIAVSDDEVVVGTDERHLDFRASVLVTGGSVTVSTIARARNHRGRAYLAVVRRIHPLVIRSMLRRAATRGRQAAGRSR